MSKKPKKTRDVLSSPPTYILKYVGKDGKVIEGYTQEVPASSDAVARGIVQAEANVLYHAYGRRGGVVIIEGNGVKFEKALPEN